MSHKPSKVVERDAKLARNYNPQGYKPQTHGPEASSKGNNLPLPPPKSGLNMADITPGGQWLKGEVSSKTGDNAHIIPLASRTPEHNAWYRILNKEVRTVRNKYIDLKVGHQVYYIAPNPTSRETPIV